MTDRIDNQKPHYPDEPLPPGTPAVIKQEDLDRFFQEKWKLKECEICEANKWGMNPPSGRYAYIPVDNGENPSTFSKLVVPAIEIFCTSCGNIKFLSVATIKSWLSTHPKDEALEK